MPTVKIVSAEALRSSIGNETTTSELTTTSPTVAIRVRNSFRMSCIPLMIRCPSSTAWATAAKESSIRTRSATPRVAWLPLPIEMARLAFLSDRTSFTPSPIIAT